MLSVIEIAPAKPVYVKPPAPKPKRLGNYYHGRPARSDRDDGTVMAWVDVEGRFWCVHPISQQWIHEETLHTLLREAAMDMPGASEPLLKMAYDWNGREGLRIVAVRFDFQYQKWFLDGSGPGVPRQYTHFRLYEVPDGQTLIDLATAWAQQEVLHSRGQVHWDAIAVLRTLNSDLGVIVDRVLKRIAPAIPPVRAEEPPQIPEESATDTNAQ
jgi:hypothetical protein